MKLHWTSGASAHFYRRADPIRPRRATARSSSPDEPRAGANDLPVEPEAQDVSPVPGTEAYLAPKQAKRNPAGAERSRLLLSACGASRVARSRCDIRIVRSAGARAAPRLCVRPGGESLSAASNWPFLAAGLERDQHNDPTEATLLDRRDSDSPALTGSTSAPGAAFSTAAQVRLHACIHDRTRAVSSSITVPMLPRLERTRSVCGASGLGGLGFLDGRPTGGGE